MRLEAPASHAKARKDARGRAEMDYHRAIDKTYRPRPGAVSRRHAGMARHFHTSRHWDVNNPRDDTCRTDRRTGQFERQGRTDGETRQGKYGTYNGARPRVIAGGLEAAHSNCRKLECDDVSRCWDLLQGRKAEEQGERFDKYR